jgi:hypothetical protein
MQFPVLAFWPQGVDRTLMEVYFLGLEGYADPDSPACQQSVALFDYITKEDLANLAHLQRSFRAGVVERFQPGYAERLIHNHHQFLDRMIGPERIPEVLRVRQIPVEAL